MYNNDDIREHFERLEGRGRGSLAAAGSSDSSAGDDASRSGPSFSVDEI